MTTQPTLSSLLATASMIVATSALALDGDDHAATVRIVEQALGKLDANEVDNFVTRGSDPATAAQIVNAALETEASGVRDEATVSSSASATPVLASDTARSNPDATSMAAMLSMIREIMLPIAEHMVAQECEMVEINARLARIEACAAGTTGLGIDMALAG